VEYIIKHTIYNAKYYSVVHTEIRYYTKFIIHSLYSLFYQINNIDGL